MQSPVASRFLRVPEDCRFLRQFLQTNKECKSALYIGAANGEDLLGWLVSTYGLQVSWVVNELVQNQSTESLFDICSDFKAQLCFEDYKETLKRKQYDIIVCNYVMHFGWDKAKKKWLHNLMKHNAFHPKLIFVRDAMTHDYTLNEQLQYREHCELYDYVCYEHKQVIDGELDRCKARDYGYILMRKDATYIPDRYTNIIKSS